jgi:heterodisulfide reductase subunit B2
VKLGLFPGCSLEGSSREYLESLTAIAPKLGLEFVEVPDWNCCGATAAHSLNAKLALALPARILALAEQAGITDLCVPCSACYARLAATRDELECHDDLKREIAAIIELPLAAVPRVRSVLDVLAAETLAGKVLRPFEHKVACYYGCYLTRPPRLSTLARPEDPREMDDLVRAVGADPLDWAFKVECCGAGLSVTRTDLVAELSGRILDDAERRGAEAIVVACPMCHTNLDLRRDAIDARRGRRSRMPVLYVSQVVGLALGLDERALGLHRHHVPVRFAHATQAIAAQED